MLGFLLGAVAGGIASYYWRDTIRDYLAGRVPDLRERAADGLGTLGGRASGALDRARSRLDAAVRTSQDRLRPKGSTEGSSFRAGNDPSGGMTLPR